jgi:single-stranded-DNA-specific exonuclease
MARWMFPAADEGAASALARELGVSRALARILNARGHRGAEGARGYLNPSAEQLLPAATLAGVDPAAERIDRAIRGGEKILLYGDYDVDGTMAVVILSAAIRVCGGSSEYHVPHRITEGYGVRTEVVERAARDGVTLIVSVDTGIRAAAAVHEATALGIDVIVTDHHLPDAELPPAYALINPNLRDCSYANKNLCGAGIAYKLALALLERQEWDAAKLERMSASFLKLAAIATVADVVPLTGENRAIVALGLDGLREVHNLGLRELLRVAAIEPGAAVSARQVGFQIGPRINAAGRMEHARLVIELFQTSERSRAAEIAEALDALNRERRETERRIVEEIFESVSDPAPGLVLAGEGWHRGVVGIVASRVVERFYRPTFVLEIDRENGVATGSGRSIPPFHLLESLESMRDVFTKFGGHSHAAGVTLPLEKLDEFRERFAGYAQMKLSADDLVPELRIDTAVEPDEVTAEFAAECFRMAPFGAGNPAPVVALKRMKVASASTMGAEGKHFKLQVERNGSRHFVKAWNFEPRSGEAAPGAVVDLAVTVKPDDYWGWSLHLEDIRQALS